MMTDAQERQAADELVRRIKIAQGFAALADILLNNPGIPLPDTTVIEWNTWESDESVAAMEHIVTTVEARWTKYVSDDPGAHAPFVVRGSLHGLGLMVTGYRNHFAAGAIVGHHEVDKYFLDSSEQLPVIHSVVTEPVFEWTVYPPFDALPDQ